MTAKLRLATGIILASYLIPHLVNHSLGLVSLAAMDAMHEWMALVWGNPLGGVLLFGSLIVHFLLALEAIYRRNHLRLRLRDGVQLVFGLLVPLLIMRHMVATRITAELIGSPITYPHVLTAIWNGGWFVISKQTALVVVVWIHAAIGLHHWIRFKPWYRRAVPVLYPAAVLLPVLALLGFFRGLADTAVQVEDKEFVAFLFAARRAAPPEIDALLLRLDNDVLFVMGGMLALTLAARQIRRLYRSRHGVYRITYPGRAAALVAPIGQTVLEAIHLAAIPHASVCGGRARCTTCRVRVSRGLEHLPEPLPLERGALACIKASPQVRLACQLRPRHDLAVVPLLPSYATVQDGRRPGGVEGQERHVTALFADLRGSTALGHARMPYDVVFVLNQFFAEMAEALNATGGHYAQFAGDGLMALYGLKGTPADGCRDALRGAADMAARLDRLNATLKTELAQPLRMGIGIHTGLAIVGTMGPPAQPIFSAIGDNINVAARLESETKRLGVTLVMSEAVATLAGVDVAGLARHQVEVRGRERDTFAVYAVDLPETLKV
ncbi:MAG: 2Fe-2S iron-sulfur cluster binding domain-containing protein [Rhodospirillales bacterium]|nr:2Fe-2S iron-sulfur cluster binding domain-containing protein [Rhodospirillales bacterium]